MQEARTEERARTYLRAQIRNPYGATHDCVVRSMSGSGAQLELVVVAPVPDEFTLYIPLRGMERRAKVMWRHARSLGIQFCDPLGDEAAHEQKGLAAENARLKALVRELTKRLEDLGQDVSTDSRY